MAKHMEDLECPVCGNNSQHGAFFYFFLEDAELCIGINFITAKGQKDLVVSYQHVFDTNIKGVRCRDCGFNADLEKFYRRPLRGFVAKVEKIDQEWSRLQIKNKRFNVLTSNLKRDVQEGDIVEVIGISLNEIEDFAMVEDKDIVIQVKGKKHE